jgi:hypothetical protein
MSERDGEHSLKFMYTDSNAGQIENEARETAENVAFDQKENYVPFSGTIVQPGGGNIHEDAIRLGRLRKQKRGDMLLVALRSLEPRLQGIEDNASSGAPLIWVDVGLSELVPLAVVGAGMTHFTRIVLAATSVPGGVVLVDEIENGLHHSGFAGCVAGDSQNGRTVRRAGIRDDAQLRVHRGSARGPRI